MAKMKIDKNLILYENLFNEFPKGLNLYKKFYKNNSVNKEIKFWEGYLTSLFNGDKTIFYFPFCFDKRRNIYWCFMYYSKYKKIGITEFYIYNFGENINKNLLEVI